MNQHENPTRNITINDNMMFIDPRFCHVCGTTLIGKRIVEMPKYHNGQVWDYKSYLFCTDCFNQLEFNNCE